MRALAIFSGLLAGLLAVVIFREQSQMTAAGAASVVQGETLQLWRPEPVTVVAPVADISRVPAPVTAEVMVASACARLGIFPDRMWAESVAVLVAAPEAEGAAATEMPWRIQSVGRKGYYAVFEGMTMDVLAGRMERRRAALSRLVSYAALPERCAGR